MSKIKKVLAMLLALAMVLGTTLTTFASAGNDGIIGTSDDTGKITVQGIDKEDEANIVVTAYPIAMAQYDKNGNFIGYNNPYNIGDITKPTQKELSDIAAGTLQKGFELTPEADGTTYSKDGLAVGMYLICVTGAEAHVYNVAVASIQYKNENGENIIDEGIVNTVSDANLWVKKSDAPTVDKVIAENDKGNSVNVGDKIPYTVSINPIPNYGGNYPKLNVVDTLSEGLTYNNDLLVKIDDRTLSEGKDYTLVVDKQKITVDFVVDGKYTLNEYVGKEVVISYSATLNEKAKLNEVNNHNDVILNYTKDSKTQGNDGNDKDKTYTYTFDIDGSITGQVSTEGIVTKVGEIEGTTGEKLPLKGAEFTLFKDSACQEVYTNPNFTTGKVTSDEKGQLHITGLGTGIYYLKETFAPDGYSLNTHVFKIEIEATYYEDGKLNTWSVKIDGSAIASFTLNNESIVTNGEGKSKIIGLDIQNTKLSSLPSTGGIGTTIFTIGGCLIMIAAAGLFFASRRKSAK